MIAETEVISALRNVYDPETGLNVVDLGLIYGVGIEDATVEVKMTFTTPACPAGEAMMEGVERAVGALPGVAQTFVDITFEPRWTPDRISPQGRVELGWEPAA